MVCLCKYISISAINIVVPNYTQRTDIHLKKYIIQASGITTTIIYAYNVNKIIASLNRLLIVQHIL